MKYLGTKKPVIVFCDDHLGRLSNFRQNVQTIYGNHVEVIVTSGFYNFRSQLNQLVEAGNFPDLMSMDGGLYTENREILLYMAGVWVDAAQAGKIDKPWPTNIYVHSFAFEVNENKLSSVECVEDMLPSDVQKVFKIQALEGDTENYLMQAIETIYPDIQYAPNGYKTEYIPVTLTDPDTSMVRGHLEHFYETLLPTTRAEKYRREGGIPCKGGFGDIVSGYVAYTVEDIERIEEKRKFARSINSQDTILVVQKFDLKEHGPLLPRIRGIVICDEVFEEHVQIALQNFGISALVGADYDFLQKNNPALTIIDEDHFYDERMGEITLNPMIGVINIGNNHKELEFLPFSVEHKIGLIQNRLRDIPLTPQLKIQADHYTQSSSNFAFRTQGIGLIRSESLTRGDAQHYDAAVAVMASIGEPDIVLAWQQAQEKALSGVVKGRRYETPVCFRLADFGSGNFLPNEQVKITQDQLGEGTVILPQGVQLARTKPHIYKGQLRAAFNDAHNYKIKDFEILIPQVETADDVQFVRNMAIEVLAEEGQAAPSTYKIGSMIETNSALGNIEAINIASDFMSIGMNDIIRVNQPVPRLWHLRQEHKKTHGYDPYIQPQTYILQKVSEAVAKVKGNDIRLCGEFAGSVDGLLFAHDNSIKFVVVTPNQKCIIDNPLIAREILWRRNQVVAMTPKSSDPITSLYAELGIF